MKQIKLLECSTLLAAHPLERQGLRAARLCRSPLLQQVHPDLAAAVRSVPHLQNTAAGAAPSVVAAPSGSGT